MSELIVPSTRLSNGGGHIKRCLRVLQEIDEALLYFQTGSGHFSREQLFSMVPEILKERILWEKSDLNQPWKWILVDQRECNEILYKELLQLNRPLLALDEGGPLRNRMDYLIDAFPRLTQKHEANYQSASLLLSGKPLDNPPLDQRKNLLISFGNEDPAGLSQVILKKISELSFDMSQVTLVKGPLFSSASFPEQITVLDAPERLDLILPQYRKVLCSFGLTAYEAEQAGSSVLLANPSLYHQKISEKENWKCLPLDLASNSAEKILRYFLQSGEPVQEKRKKHGEKGLCLADFLKAFEIEERSCPCCRREKSPILSRTPAGNYHLCASCGNIYLVTYMNEETRYDESYFFEDYRKQYGKTYLEDFEHIYHMGKERMVRIQKSVSHPLESLVDLGCAYGPFLKAASEQIEHVQGVELSGDAVLWVKENLKFPVHHNSLLDPELDALLRENKVDVCTLWYVIEHFREQDLLLSRCTGWLKTGGVLAFATPNGAGISARKNIKCFLDASPADHYIIYKPLAVKKLLKNMGYKIRKIHITGHHPERIIPGIKPGGILYKLLMLISKCFRLGDTFEVYAEKR